MGSPKTRWRQLVSPPKWGNTQKNSERLASTTRREALWAQTSKDDFLSTQTRVYLQGHVTAKEVARL
jgi:hypothetical protein